MPIVCVLRVNLSFSLHHIRIELEAPFPYRDVALRRGDSPKDHYDISEEELGRYIQIFI